MHDLGLDEAEARGISYDVRVDGVRHAEVPHGCSFSLAGVDPLKKSNLLAAVGA